MATRGRSRLRTGRRLRSVRRQPVGRGLVALL